MPHPDTSRLGRIIALHAEALRQRMGSDGTVPRGVTLDMLMAIGEDDDASDEVALSFFVEADPTPRHRYTQWLVRTYIAGGFLWEDLGKARETLTLFHDNRHRMGPAADLYRHRSLGALWAAVGHFAGTQSANGIDRAERDAARAESVIVLDAVGWTVAVPLTERAAVWWGRGTRWCTSATRSENRFLSYHRDGPLVVVVAPDGRKWQGWVRVSSQHSPSAQFTNAADAPVFMNETADGWVVLEPLWRWFCAQSPAAFGVVLGNHGIAEDMRSAAASRPRELMLSMRSSGQRLKHEFFATLGSAGVARLLRSSPFFALHEIPGTMRDEAACQAVVDREKDWAAPYPGKRGKGAFSYWLPSDMPAWFLVMRPELWPEAVRRSPRFLSRIPFEHRSAELCLLAAQHGGLRSDIPGEHHTREVEIACHRNGQEGGPHLLLGRRLDEELILAALAGGTIPIETPDLFATDAETARKRLLAAVDSEILRRGNLLLGITPSVVATLPPGTMTPELATHLCLRFSASGFTEQPGSVLHDLYELAVLPSHGDQAAATRSAMLRRRLCQAPPAAIDLALQQRPALVPYLPQVLMTRDRVLAAVSSPLFSDHLHRLGAFHHDAEIVNAAFKHSWQPHLPESALALVDFETILRHLEGEDLVRPDDVGRGELGLPYAYVKLTSYTPLMTEEQFRSLCTRRLRLSGDDFDARYLPSRLLNPQDRERVLREAREQMEPSWDVTILDELKKAMAAVLWERWPGTAMTT